MVPLALFNLQTHRASQSRKFWVLGLFKLHLVWAAPNTSEWSSLTLVCPFISSKPLVPLRTDTPIMGSKSRPVRLWDVLKQHWLLPPLSLCCIQQPVTKLFTNNATAVTCFALFGSHHYMARALNGTSVKCKN